YRLGDLPDTAVITIDQGPAPFDCTSLSLLEAGAPPTGGGTGGDMTGDDMTGEGDMMGDDVLTVPVTAVRGMGEDASVWVTDDMGEPEERSVEIGMSDGTRAEVVSGLEAGDAILEYVPGTEPDEDEGMDFGMIG